jgi:hypothetical protein
VGFLAAESTPRISIIFFRYLIAGCRLGDEGPGGQGVSLSGSLFEGGDVGG